MSGSGHQHDQPWLWNLSSQNPEPMVPVPIHRRGSSNAQAGALEHITGYTADSAPQQSFHPAPGTNGVKMPHTQQSTLLSSRTSVDYGDGIANGNASFAGGGSGAIANQTQALPEDTNRQSTAGGRSSRMGSMTKRLSTLGLGRKGSRDKVKSPIDSVAE